MTRRARAAFALASLAGALAAAGDGRALPVAPPPRAAVVLPPLSDTQEVVFLAAPRPLRIRVVARLDGRPLAEAWDAALRRLFDACDRNGDGFLDAKEVQHLLPAESFKVLIETSFNNGGSVSPPALAAVDADGDGRVSFAEVDAFYRAAVGSPLAASIHAPEDVAGVRRTRAFFRLLDANGDGKLTRDEVNGAERLLADYDANDDECLTAAELFPAFAPVPAADGPVRPLSRPTHPAAGEGRGALPLRVFPHGRVPGTVTQQVLQAYDRDGDYELTRDESGFDPATFRLLDADGNGKLTGEELDAWRRGSPDLEIALSVGPKAADARAVLLTRPAAAAARGLTVGQSRAEITVTCGRQTMSFRAEGSGPYGGGRPTMKGIHDGHFKAASKGRSFVEFEDFAGPLRTVFEPIFGPADFDDDGKLTRVEFDRYFAVLQAVADLGIGTAHALRSPNLFQLLDANGDGRLTVREMRGGWGRLQALAAGGDSLDPGAFRPAVAFHLVRGPERQLGAGQDYWNPANRPPPVPPANRGPLWFRKMDRNDDGDVSRKEFLGDGAEFAAIDADGDGLLSADEAIAYDGKKRKKGK